MTDSFMSQGFDLLVAGMGTVFVFLTLLVFMTRIMSSFIVKYLPELPDPEPIGASTSSASSSNGAPVDPKVLSIIQAAIKQHKKS